MSGVNTTAIDAKQEVKRITDFLAEIFSRTGKKNAVIGWSGGIDSTVSLYLLARILPLNNIFVMHLPYTTSFIAEFKDIGHDLRIPDANIREYSIRQIAGGIKKELGLNNDRVDRIRFGNIMARLRMIILFDRAREIDGLVCGTENKSEHLLGYFTRYGDGASDIEPIVHLYKTQVYQIARHLEVPDNFITKSPSAGLWTGQTDEGEFGFSYEEADMVLHLYFDLKQSVDEIVARGFTNANKIIGFANKNEFKHVVPYRLT